MRHIDAFVSDVVRLTLQITEDNIGITGETPLVKIKRMSDNYYYTGAAWQASVTTISCAEYNSSYFPGLYQYAFTTTATEDTYLVAFSNGAGTYALNDNMILTTRLRPMNNAAATRSSTSPASSTYGEKLEELYAAVTGRMLLNNGGTGGRIMVTFYNYAETNVIKTMDILKPAGTVNSQTLDTNAMAGRIAST